MEKQDLRNRNTSERLALRKSAISMIKQGVKKKDVVVQLGVNKNTVTNWWRSYQEQGVKSYRYSKPGPRPEDKKLLDQEQESAIQKMMTDTMPDQLKLDHALWTRWAVKELVEREFGVALAITTMGDYLRKWGHTPQKPAKRAHGQCPQKVRKWLDGEYPKIKAQAKEENAEVHWVNGTRGRTPVPKSMSKRFSVNMISSVTDQGKVRFMLYKDTMNADRFIEFLKRLVKSSDKKPYVILDNLRVHHSKIVKQWVEENKGKIALFHLPSHSPELNPD